MPDVLVLCYHSLSPTWGVDISVTPEAFERQVTYLTRSGWHAVTFREAVLAPPSRLTLALTFDDSFSSVKQYAVPVLSRLGLPATVFAPTSYVSRGQRLTWSGMDHWNESPHAEELAPMSWEDLGELADAGWEIGSHTCTHPHLTQLGDEELRAELQQSRVECAQRIGHRCDTIAYPYGDVDERVAECARAVGYRAGAALSSSLEHLGAHRWPRTGIYRDDAWWRFRVKTLRPIRALRATKTWARSA